jgi:hypothetical protein
MLYISTNDVDYLFCNFMVGLSQLSVKLVSLQALNQSKSPCRRQWEFVGTRSEFVGTQSELSRNAVGMWSERLRSMYGASTEYRRSKYGGSAEEISGCLVLKLLHRLVK